MQDKQFNSKNSLFLIKITVCSSLQCLISSSGILVEYLLTQCQTKKPVPPLIGDILAEVVLRRTVRRVGHHHFSEIFVRAVRPSSISGSCTTTTGMQRLCNFFLLPLCYQRWQPAHIYPLLSTVKVRTLSCRPN